MRQHRNGEGQRVQREIAENEAYLAGIDIGFLDLGQDLAVEAAAMAAGQRRMLLDGDRRIRAAHGHFAQDFLRIGGKGAGPDRYQSDKRYNT